MTTTALVKLTDDPEYDKLVGDACVLTQKTSAQLLLFYWELGRIVKTATNGAASGVRTVPDFLKHMHMVAPGRISLKDDSMYNALNINEHLSRTELQTLQDEGAALRNVLLLCNKNVTSEMRKDAIARIASKELDPEDVDDFIKASRAQQEAEKPAGMLKSGSDGAGGSAGSSGSTKVVPKQADTKRAATIQVSRFPGRVNALAEHMSGYADSLDVLGSSATDEDEIDDIQQYFRDGIKAMEDLFTTWDATAKAARKAMDRTITTMAREERTGKTAGKKPAKKK